MIKRPGNEFIIVDNSGKYVTTEPLLRSPLLFTAASFDKGDERLMEISGDDFFRMFGENISFERHGQPALQAANVIRNGGRLLIKRIVADDATLANAIVTATVKKTQVPKTDPVSGDNIYIDRVTGTETTEASSSSGENERALINTADITYNVVSISGAKTMKELQVAAKGLIVEKDAVIVPTTPAENATEPEVPATPPTTGGDESVDNTESTNEAADTTETAEENTEVSYAGASTLSAIPGNIPLPVGLTDTEGSTESEYTYPLFIFADNGRGVSSKRVNVAADYAVSKNLKFVLYKLNNIGSLDLDSEYIRFALDPDTVYQGTSMSLSESGKQMVQINPAGVNEGISKFIDKVSEFSGLERNEVTKMDILFGKDARGTNIDQISINPDGYDLTSELGITLENGSNGAFGTHPFGTEAYSQKLVDFFTGKDDPAVFDVEEHKIEALVDANYPMEVKQAITSLVDFRKDFVFFRDLGIGLESHDAIALMAKSLKDTMYAANYCQSYDVIDPFSKRQVSVTIGYDIARLLISHMNDFRNTPFCGQLYNVNIPDIVEGTVSYIPRIMPNIDQKQNLYDIHMNYATMVNGLLTLETQINSQTDVTQCSWINNILTVQAIIRDIRETCPRIRYSFIDRASGLNRYAQNVNKVLSRHKSEVESLEFEWSSDEIELANHIFNATIKVKFKEYVDFEKFTIYVID